MHDGGLQLLRFLVLLIVRRQMTDCNILWGMLFNLEKICDGCTENLSVCSV